MVGGRMGDFWAGNARASKALPAQLTSGTDFKMAYLKSQYPQHSKSRQCQPSCRNVKCVRLSSTEQPSHLSALARITGQGNQTPVRQLRPIRAWLERWATVPPSIA